MLHTHVKDNSIFNTLEFGGIKNQVGKDTFSIYTKDLISMELLKEEYNQEEKPQILMANAAEFLPFYCDTPNKEQALVRRKEERGW